MKIELSKAEIVDCAAGGIMNPYVLRDTCRVALAAAGLDNNGNPKKLTLNGQEVAVHKCNSKLRLAWAKDNAWHDWVSDADLINLDKDSPEGRAILAALRGDEPLTCCGKPVVVWCRNEDYVTVDGVAVTKKQFQQILRATEPERQRILAMLENGHE